MLHLNYITSVWDDVCRAFMKFLILRIMFIHITIIFLITMCWYWLLSYYSIQELYKVALLSNPILADT